MARSVTFNGITRYKPGGITRINAEALNQVILSANSVVALIGEAEGGAPGSESGLVSLFDPSRASREFRSGALVDAARVAFQSSGDPIIVGGASQVYLWKTNDSTRSSLSLPSQEAATVLNSTATGGAASTLIDTTGLATGTYKDDELIGMWVVIRPFTSTAEVRRVTDYADATSTITVNAAWGSAPLATERYLLLKDEVELMDTVDTGGTHDATHVAVDGTLVAEAHIGRWLYIVDAGSSVTGVPTTLYLRKIVDNTTGEFEVTPALPAAVADGGYVQVLPNAVDLVAKDWGEHTNGLSIESAEGTTSDLRVMTTFFEGEEEVSPELGGVKFFHLLYKGAGVAASDTVTGSASTAAVINLTTGGLTPDAHIGQQALINGEYTTIIDNDAVSITVSPALSEAPDASDAVVITTLTRGYMKVTGTLGKATGLETWLVGPDASEELDITFSNQQTLRQLVDQINANPNYLATIPNGINPDTTLVADFDFGPDTATTVLNSHDLDTTIGLTQDLKDNVDYFVDFSELVDAVRSTDSGSDVAGSRPPAAWDPAATPPLLGAEDPFSFTGGTRGVSSNTKFQEGFDALLKVRANSVVPLIDQDLVNEGFGSTATVASVAAQLVDHVAISRGSAQNVAGERGGFVGFRGSKSEVIAQANALNDFDVHLLAQNPTVLNAQGSLEEFGPRIMATMGASMRAGVPEVAEPLTFKYLRVSGLTQDSSWDPADLTDANDMIKAGVLFAETIQGKGTRWVRDLTTHVKDDNLAYVEGSVRDAVRFVAWELRSRLVDRFTGRKAKPTTITTYRDTAVAVLEELRDDNIIVDSTDPTTGATIRAWHNLKVWASGDIVTLNVGIFPVPGINFQLNDIFLQLPTQAA